LLLTLALTATPATAATLVGFAELPADTFATGPDSGVEQRRARRNPFQRPAGAGVQRRAVRQGRFLLVAE
ncbi:hypothetical protein, partial [Deinococcus cavernae]|uniref:hypothetical protein n=1 Tax=Deinococcus cavernae TaxID=2320857 RepID=UPI001F1A8DCA